jgi:DNA polymerase III delta subunit
MSIKNFFEQMKKGFRAAVYLLHAEDPYFLKESLLTVKRNIPEAERDFTFHSFDLDSPDSSAPVEHIIDTLNTAPFFGGRQVVAVENAQKLKEGGLEALSGYIENPSPDSVLFLLNIGTIKKAHRERLKGAKLIPMDIKERDLPYWLMEKARAKGITLAPGAVEYLIGTVGPDAGLLSSEVEKLTLIGKEKLERDDIAEMVKGSGDYDVFDLIDALKARDAARVFGIYRALSETQESYSMLGALNWHYGRVAGRLKNRREVFALLNEADTMVKSTGGLYPVELLLVRLLRL